MAIGSYVMGELDLVVPASLDGVRVDRAVCLLSERSRAATAAVIEGGGVRLDDHPVRRGSTVLRAGQRLVVDDTPEGSRSPAIVPDPSVAYEVVFADDDVIVVDKPPGLVVHPGAGHRTGTLVHGLLTRFPDLGALPAGRGADAERPGVVHRLDRGTSGLLVVARTESARAALVAQLANHRVERTYRALVHGEMESETGTVDAPIGRSTRVPTRMAIERHGRPARTRYRVDQRFPPPDSATFLTVSLETGRTHQIRVHLAAIGHPVVADDVYGRGRRWPQTTLERPFLHASALRFDHPATGEPIAFGSPLPADLEAELTRITS